MSEACVVITPSANANASIIWLHGLGADGYDFVPVASTLPLSPAIQPRFLFPHATQRAVGINGGAYMRAWYDIVTPDIMCDVDTTGILASVTQIEHIIDAEIAYGIAAQRIILAGFSQGGVIALHTACSNQHRLAGVIGLSTYLPAMPEIPKLHYPLWLAHGRNDEVIPYAEGEDAWRRISRQNQASWNSYPMGHQVCDQQLADITDWLNLVLHV